MKQISFSREYLPRPRIEFGGSLLLGRRRKRRPLSTKCPIHLVLRSDFAYGSRSLLRHRPLINKILRKASRQFHIKIYEKAIAYNHIHILVKGKDREELQNFFRVVAGHIAQGILKKSPILRHEKPKRGGALGGEKNPKANGPLSGEHGRDKANTFWQTRLYSRLVRWGRDYLTVRKYLVQNTLEALGLVPYKERRTRYAAIANTS